jgi:protein gp37
MSESTKIEWCDSTFNPWIGCTKISPGCDNCYAAVSTPARSLGIEWGDHARHRTSASNWNQVRRWNRNAQQFADAHGGRRRRVFCASLADVFDNAVPMGWRRDLFFLMSETPNLEWLVLTKRIGNVRKMVDEQGWWPRNAALGYTAVNQPEIERDWPKAQDCKMALPLLYLFVSIEPMLGPVLLDSVQRDAGEWTVFDDALSGFHATQGGGASWPGLDWVIAGGESGPNARPAHPEWFRSLRNQCAAAEVPFLFKQWGEYASVSEVAGEGEHHAFPDGTTVRRVGKQIAGRQLDGREHSEWPQT